MSHIINFAAKLSDRGHDQEDPQPSFSPVINQWYRAYRQKLLLKIQAITNNRHSAEELVHECFIKLSRMPAIETISHPEAFISKVALNMALDAMRRDKRLTALDEEAMLLQVADEPQPLDLVVRKQRISKLYQVIDQLPARSREVLLLVRLREMTLKEAALELGISQTMVEKHLRRALQQCRTALIDSEY